MQDYGGWQDQVFSAYGGIADIKFENNKFYVSSIRPNKNSISKLNQNLILIAEARDVDKKKLNKNKKKLNENIISLRSFKDLYDSTSKALFQGDIDDLKLILNECHILKQKYTSIHNKKTKFICDILDKIKCSYKVIGSGNGGSIFTFGDDYIYKKILHNFKLNNINDITILPVKINFSGTKIIKPFNNFN